MDTTQRKYPVGVQTFEKLRNEGYIYVDKSDLVWKMTKTSPYVFLSRPRRFGKSLLSTTLVSYFHGDRHLFEGLKIMDLEKEWKQYPVLHLDISKAKGQESAEELRDRLSLIIKPYLKEYGTDPDEKTPGAKLEGAITRAYNQTNTQVVVVIDEYDSPLLEVMHDEALNSMRKVMQEFYQPLKACEGMIRFCFITGITKFSQLSIFSTLNNLRNVSMNPEFSAICGITETELSSAMAEDIHLMAEEMGISDEEMHLKLKQRYDGYHFSDKSEDIYNPFSLMNAFADKAIKNYWFSSGTPGFLIEHMLHFKTDITNLDSIDASATDFDAPTEVMEDAIPMMYQAGYLTIKNYDPESELFTLAIPNREVRVGLTECLMKSYTGLTKNSVRQGFAIKFYRAIKKDDIETALDELDAFLESLPYVEGFKQKLNDAEFREGFYEYTFFLIFSMLDAYVHTQVKRWRGRIDMVVQTPQTTFLFEFKIRDDADNGTRSSGPRRADEVRGRRIVKVGIRFDTETWTIKERKIENA